MSYAVTLRDPRGVLVSGPAGADGDLVEQIKDNCGFVVRGINWVLEQIGINLLDALFDKLAGDFSTVSVMAEDWRRTGIAAGILAENYRAMADAIPEVWTGDAAVSLTAKLDEFGDSMADASECVDMIQMAIGDMLAATKAAMEVVATTLSLIDDLCMYFAGSLAKLAKEIFTGGRRIREIISLARDVIRILEELADLIPALTKTAAAVSVVMRGLDFVVLGSTAKNNSDVANQADDASDHFPTFPRGR
jgi:uncharacterized protein YukE